MKDPDLEEAKAWFYTEYGRTPWYKRPYYRIKEWLANWACGCDTVRGDAAVLLMWRMNNPKPERVKIRQETLERAKEYYDVYSAEEIASMEAKEGERINGRRRPP